jgi:chemotaxis protein MotB
MKINRIATKFVFVLGTGLTLYSCGPVYKCGETRPDGFVAGNRMLAVVNERDELCTSNKDLETSIGKLTDKNKALTQERDSVIVLKDSIKNEYGQLNTKYSAVQQELADSKKTNLNLREQYNSAVTENLNQGHLYDERLKEKERRLGEREKEITERENKIKELQAEIARRDSITNRLNQMLQGALLGFEKDELSIEIKNGKVYVSMSDKLMFKSGKADVQEKGIAALDALGKVLAKNENFEILVEGHTDNVPIKTAQYNDNWDLSAARSIAVVRILQTGGTLNPARLTAAGKGEYEPKASNDTPEGRAKNRRTEIILTPNLSELMNYIEKK